MKNIKAKRVILKRIIVIGRKYFNLDKSMSKHIFGQIINNTDYSKNRLINLRLEIIENCKNKMIEHARRN